MPLCTCVQAPVSRIGASLAPSSDRIPAGLGYKSTTPAHHRALFQHDLPESHIVISGDDMTASLSDTGTESHVCYPAGSVPDEADCALVATTL